MEKFSFIEKVQNIRKNMFGFYSVILYLMDYKIVLKGVKVNTVLRCFC